MIRKMASRPNVAYLQIKKVPEGAALGGTSFFKLSVACPQISFERGKLFLVIEAAKSLWPWDWCVAT